MPGAEVKQKSRRLRVGDWVEVRSKEEILETLDSNGQLDGMLFMPEMFAFCGNRFQVYKRAHKTCDTVFPVRGRRVDRAVHLETRCDGSAHGGCHASCLIFWKEEWLKHVKRGASPGAGGHVELKPESTSTAVPLSRCTEQDVIDRTEKTSARGMTSYMCQATQLPYASTNLEWWDVDQYVEDYRSGNVSLWRIICGGIYFLYYALTRAGIGLGQPMRWFYDRFHPLWRGTPFPRRVGMLRDQPTPAATLNLQPGELVRIKSYKEILWTLNAANMNRGLYFDAEEVPYCGKSYRVLRRVDRIIDEKTGKMIEMKTPSVILDSVICEARFSECRMFCPRSIYPYWREIWLDRVEPSPARQTKQPGPRR